MTQETKLIYDVKSRVTDNMMETLASFIDYWDESRAVGLSVREFLELADSLAPDGEEPSSAIFKQIKATYAPVNDGEIEAMAAKTAELVGREMVLNFPQDAEFAEMTRTLGINILEGRAMALRPKFVTFEEAVVPAMMSKKKFVKLVESYNADEDQPGFMPMADVMPDWTTYLKSSDRKDNHVMRFKPKYRIATIDEYLIRALNPDVYKRTNYPKPFLRMALVAVGWLRRKVLAVGAEWVLANGDAESQLLRYLRSLAVRAGLIGHDISEDPAEELKLPAFATPVMKAQILKVMDDLYPMFSRAADEGVDVFAPGNSILDAAATREEFDGLQSLVFNKRSNAGLMFPDNSGDIKNVKIGNVTYQNVIMSNMLLQQLRTPGQSFKGAFRAAKTAQLKSKWEPITIVKNAQKVRNIMNANTFAQMPMSMLCRNTTMLNMVQEWEVAKEFFLEAKDDAGRVVILKKVTSRHLLGFSPFKGGLNSLFEYCELWIKYVGSTILFTYADNLYGFVRIGSKWHWLSVDGRAFESQSTHESAESFAARISRANGLTGEWHKYCNEFWPWATINMIGVLGKEQFVFPGLGSGSAATAYANTERMLYLVAYIKVHYSDSNGGVRVLSNEKEFHPEFVQCLKAVKLDLEITQVTPWNFSHSPGKYTLDLLGYDCVKTMIGGSYYYVPYLTEDRVIRAVSFNKSTAVKTDFTNDQLMAMRLMKYQLLYYVGGWVVDELSLALTMLCRYTVGRLGIDFDMSLVDDVMDELSDSAGVEFLDRDSITDEMRPAVPSPYDCMRFAVGDEVAELWTKDLKERDISLLLEAAGFSPTALLTEEGEIRPPSILDDLLAETDTIVRSAENDFIRLEMKEIEAVTGGFDKPLSVTAARDHVLRGAMGALERYKAMDEEARKDATRRLIERSGWPSAYAPSTLAGLSHELDKKSRTYDIAAVISATTNSNILLVVDYLHKIGFDVSKYPPVSKEAVFINKLNYYAKQIKRTGAKGAPHALVRAFIAENRDALIRLSEGWEDWALMSELDQFEADGDLLVELNKQLRDLQMTRQERELVSKQIATLENDDDDEFGEMPDWSPKPPQGPEPKAAVKVQRKPKRQATRPRRVYRPLK